MKAWTDKLASFAPPMWLTAAVAAVLAVALLSAFVDALHENVRRGAEIRRMQATLTAPNFQAVVAEASHARDLQPTLR